MDVFFIIFIVKASKIFLAAQNSISDANSGTGNDIDTAEGDSHTAPKPTTSANNDVYSGVAVEQQNADFSSSDSLYFRGPPIPSPNDVVPLSVEFC
jgi:hypothetical protein